MEPNPADCVAARAPPKALTAKFIQMRAFGEKAVANCLKRAQRAPMSQPVVVVSVRENAGLWNDHTFAAGCAE
jgi:hypothetical protein